jgi:uncharacterized protein (TIGR04222 family)
MQNLNAHVVTVATTVPLLACAFGRENSRVISARRFYVGCAECRVSTGPDTCTIHGGAGERLISEQESALHMVTEHRVDLPDWLMSDAYLSGMLSFAPGSMLGPLNIMSLLAAVAIAFIAWQAWSIRPRIEHGRETPTVTPPGDLHPAYAGALTSGRIRDTQIEATILEMIRHRVLELEPDHDERDKVQLRILQPNETRNPVEEKLMALLRQRSSNGVINYRSLSRLRNQWGDVRAALQAELAEAGWLNPSALQTRLPFVLPGSLGLILAIAMIPGAFIVNSGWPLLGGLIVGITGSVVLIAGSIIPHTTAAGEREALPWRGLRTGLANAREDSNNKIDLDVTFPYIVAMGMAPAFERYLRRASQSGYIPDWIGPRRRVQEWPEGWHTYWIAIHTALAPTDSSNTKAPSGSPWRRSLTGGRF